MAEDNSGGMGWFLAGLGFGALIGVLFAPKPGSETRSYIMDRAGDGKDYLANSAARESFNEWMERGKEFVERQKQQAQMAMDSAKQAYREKTEAPHS